MPAEWYCRIAGEEHGPLSASQLRAMVATGHLSPGDAVRQGGAGVWVPAASVKGLFGGQVESPAADPPPIPPPPPPPVPSGRTRPLLRAVPMDDQPAEEPPPRVPKRLLDRQDAGLDLAQMAPKGASQPPKLPKGWRNTGLDFLTEEKPLSASRPKPIPASSVGQAKDLADPVRRWAIPVLGGVLVLLLIVLLVVVQFRDRWTSAGASGSSPGTSEASSTGGPAAASAHAKGAAERMSEPPGVTWIDAMREAWKCGEVTVKVRAAAIARARVIDSAKRIADTQEDYLLLLLDIANTSATRKIEYTGWGARGEQPRLTDNLKNAYTVQVAPGGGIFDGQQRGKSIYPEKTLEDLLVFERPVGRAQSLRLQLPAAAFQGTGTGYIEIPMAMVKSELGPEFRRTLEPAATKPKSAVGNGAEKTSDKAEKDDGKKGPRAEKPSAADGDRDHDVPKRSGVPADDFGIKPEDAPTSPSPGKGLRGPPPPPPLKKDKE